MGISMLHTDYGQNFHDDMHRLIFRDVGATRLGAVQTTIVWQFVISNYKNITTSKCKKILILQMEVNKAKKNSDICNNAVNDVITNIAVA